MPAGSIMTVFSTSDLHLGHRAALGMCSRPFRDVEDTNAQLVGNINERAGGSDTLWVLGGVSCRISREKAEALLRAMVRYLEELDGGQLKVLIFSYCAQRFHCR